MADQFPDWLCGWQRQYLADAPENDRPELLRLLSRQRVPDAARRWGDFALPQAPAGDAADRGAAAAILVGPSDGATDADRLAAEQAVHDIADQMLFQMDQSRGSPTLEEESRVVATILRSATELDAAIGKLTGFGLAKIQNTLCPPDRRAIVETLLVDSHCSSVQGVLPSLIDAVTSYALTLKDMAGPGRARLHERAYGDPRRSMIWDCASALASSRPGARLSATPDGELMRAVWATFRYALGPQADDTNGKYFDQLWELVKDIVPSFNKQRGEKSDPAREIVRLAIAKGFAPDDDPEIQEMISEVEGRQRRRDQYSAEIMGHGKRPTRRKRHR